MPLNIGDRLGHYDVTALIGEGGMGRVYRATDTKLNRQVALKILPEAFSADPDRLVRFQREAQVLASLNHPNIAAIHGIEEVDDTRALVLELVDGSTLADRIAHGPIPVDEALPIAKQIAEALEAAHEAGVIHRDLKPANIKVRDDGTVKVLDFGLAKALDATPEGDPNQSPTLTAAATQMGVIMGTAAYMSPEQARGKPVDKRADIWAFGCVLYEMLAGKRVFDGVDVSETLAKVIGSEPNLVALPAEAPKTIAQVLRRCLQKDRRRRFRDIGDVWLDLLLSEEPSEDARSIPSPVLRVIPIAGLVVLVAVLAGWIGVSFGRSGPLADRRQTTFSIPWPLGAVDERVTSGERAARVSMSPDGSQLVLSQLGTPPYVRALDRQGLRSLSDLDLAGAAFFSPDSEWIGFFAEGRLSKVRLDGGEPIVLSEVPGAFVGANWSADDAILFAVPGGERSGIYRVPGSGGTPQRVIALKDGETASSPLLLPEDRMVLYTLIPDGSPSLFSQIQIVAESLDDGQRHVLVEQGLEPWYTPTGHLLYVQEGALKAMAWNPQLPDVTTNAVTLVEGVATQGPHALYGVSADGTLAYAPAETFTRQAELVWVDRGGQATPASDRLADYAPQPRFSPDGRRLAVTIRENFVGEGSVWLMDLERGSSRPLSQEMSSRPVWSPDGRHLAFQSAPSGSPDIYRTEVDGAGVIEAWLTRSEEPHPAGSPSGLFWGAPGQWPDSWSPDGAVLAFEESTGGSARDIWLLPRSGEPVRFTSTPASERSAAFSPDGEWLAFVSNESGQDEVYALSYPNADRKLLVSVGGGREPVWSRDGLELFYRTADYMKVVEVRRTPFGFGPPQNLFATGPRFRIEQYMPSFDVSPDGDRFLMIRDVSSGTARISVTLNWFGELTERVPVR